jgi:hypothetical protein
LHFLVRGDFMTYATSISSSRYVAWFVVGAASFLATGSFAQERIYRCNNNVYTNTLQDPKAQGCKPMEGGNVTVVQGTRPAAGGVKIASATQAGSQRVDAGDQRARDSDARLILESELKRAEARQAELHKEYNNGEPDKQGIEGRNHQKYLDRVADLKAALERNESDIAGIRRELGRVTAAK